MTKIQQPLNFVKLAQMQGKKLASIPLKDKSTAKLLFNDNALDCFIVKNGKILEGKGARMPEWKLDEEFGIILDKLTPRVAEGFNIVKEIASAFVRNVK